MAFALAIKSKFDLPRVGSIFFLLTMLITAFTLVYSAFFLDYTLNQCGVILKDETNNSKKEAFLDNNFNKNERKVTFKGEELDEENEKEKVINHSFLHEDLDQYENNNYKNKTEDYLLKNNSDNSNNYFDILKQKVIKFNEDYLIPMVLREERMSICSNYSGNVRINLDTINMKDLKKSFMENKEDL
jgi:uncharacterized membrane protein